MKRVRFSPEPRIMGLVIARCELTTDEISNTWWSHDDMKDFFASAKTLSRNTQRNMVSGFEQAYETSQRMAYSQKVKSSLRAELGNIRVDQGLLDWCRFGHSWRGLERASSVAHNEARMSVAQKARAIVLESKDAINAMDADVIQNAYEQASRSSKIFARVLGEADAMVNTTRCCIKKHKPCRARPIYPRKRSRRALMVRLVL